MKKTIELLSNRRIWAGLVGVAAFLIASFNLPNVIGDEAKLIELLTVAGTAVSNAIVGILALWSYFKPKK